MIREPLPGDGTNRPGLFGEMHQRATAEAFRPNHARVAVEQFEHVIVDRHHDGFSRVVAEFDSFG